MTARVVRVGLIGAGGIARTHAANLRGLEGVHVAAVMDPVLERAEALAAECGARAFEDLEPLFEAVDAVYVCSPPTFHRAQVEAAAAAGKHVYLEKPIATTLEDGRAIAAGCPEAQAARWSASTTGSVRPSVAGES